MNIIHTLFNTASGKKICFLGWAFKKDTNDTRETAAMYVASILLQDKAEIHVYDPKVSSKQIYSDLLYLTELKHHDLTENEIRSKVFVYDNPYTALEKAHAVAVLTEWDEFISYDWQKIYNNMLKPAFAFDGRNILDAKMLKNLGFNFYQIGK